MRRNNYASKTFCLHRAWVPASFATGSGEVNVFDASGAGFRGCEQQSFCDIKVKFPALQLLHLKQGIFSLFERVPPANAAPCRTLQDDLFCVPWESAGFCSFCCPKHLCPTIFPTSRAIPLSTKDLSIKWVLINDFGLEHQSEEANSGYIPPHFERVSTHD